MVFTSGDLVPLRTRAELLARDEIIHVYVAEIPKKRASLVLNAIKTIPGQTDMPLLHLRRFAKADFVPDRVRALTSTVSSCSTIPPHPETFEKTYAKHDGEETMHVLLCPTALISHSDLTALIARTLQGYRTIKVVSTPVPLHAPTSQDQAAAKSATYWPTVFLNGNPFGPHPVIVAKAQQEMEQDATGMMSLAHAAGEEGHSQGLGCGCGVTVVERSEQGNVVEVVAVAGDGRWAEMGKNSGKGNPGGHAVMRAIALVAKKRRLLAGSTRYDDHSSTNVFAGEPLTPLETLHFGRGKLVPNGYLCLNLEFWITHEPCTMCCMAMLHSRVGRIVFGQRMRKTGAMKVDCMSTSLRTISGNGRAPSPKRLEATEDGLEYGLFWRDDLNWRFLCWEWIGIDGQQPVDTGIDQDTQI